MLQVVPLPLPLLLARQVLHGAMPMHHDLYVIGYVVPQGQRYVRDHIVGCHIILE